MSLEGSDCGAGPLCKPSSLSSHLLSSLLHSPSPLSSILLSSPQELLQVDDTPSSLSSPLLSSPPSLPPLLSSPPSLLSFIPGPSVSASIFHRLSHEHLLARVTWGRPVAAHQPITCHRASPRAVTTYSGPRRRVLRGRGVNEARTKSVAGSELFIIEPLFG